MRCLVHPVVLSTTEWYGGYVEYCKHACTCLVYLASPQWPVAPDSRCIAYPKTEVIPKEYEWFTELYSMKTEVTMMISPDP